MLKAEYFIPSLITLGITALVGYALYQKYKPTVDAVNATNSVIGAGENAVKGFEDWFSNLFGNMNGNGIAATPNYTSTTPALAAAQSQSFSSPVPGTIVNGHVFNI